MLEVKKLIVLTNYRIYLAIIKNISDLQQGDVCLLFEIVLTHLLP